MHAPARSHVFCAASSSRRRSSDHPIQTDWVSGASMIVRRQVFEQIGLLDEGYFTYFDDIDLCLAACRAGWRTWYTPTHRKAGSCIWSVSPAALTPNNGVCRPTCSKPAGAFF
ncbi:MAG: glycosyltransferase [Rhodanobacter sp.]|nr:glycosyltransferase [Rhodanobacter sp.]